MFTKHTTKKGNIVILRDDDTITIDQVTKPELTYVVDELISALEYLNERGFFIHEENKNETSWIFHMRDNKNETSKKSSS